MSILEVNNVSKSFGGVKANVDISMSVDKGKIVGLIGPNGSGKTTLFNSIVGTYPIDKGSIKFNGKEVSELPVPVIAITGTGNSETSLPLNLIDPLSIGYVPTIELNNVVFPDPFGPIRPTIFPLSTDMEISTFALTPPNDLLTLFTSKILI